MATIHPPTQPGLAVPPARPRRARRVRRPVVVPRPLRQFGYLVAIAINLAMLWIVLHLLEWGWPAFLTRDFEDVRGLVAGSIFATIAANLLFLVRDGAWLKSLANVVTAAIGFVVAVRMYQVFPFDFSSYDYDWTPIARLAIIAAAIGTAVGFVVDAIKVVTWPFRSRDASPD